MSRRGGWLRSCLRGAAEGQVLRRVRRELAFTSSAARPPWSASSASCRLGTTVFSELLHWSAYLRRCGSATDVCAEGVSIELSFTPHHELTDRLCSASSEMSRHGHGHGQREE